jgi:hypothetical protein
MIDEYLDGFKGFDLKEVEIQVHETPNDFYLELRRLVKVAKRHVYLSALYLGSGQREKQLIEDIGGALQENSELQVTFLLDHSRARRGGESSIDLLTPLLLQFPHRLRVHFYQMPQLRNAPYCWFPYWLQEIVAVYHCKVIKCNEFKTSYHLLLLLLLSLMIITIILIYYYYYDYYYILCTLLSHCMIACK